MIGFKTRRVVEMCCGSGNECMSTNLILNRGFDGYLFDGDQNNIRGAEAFFRGKKECLLSWLFYQRSTLKLIGKRFGVHFDDSRMLHILDMSKTRPAGLARAHFATGCETPQRVATASARAPNLVRL